jgi:DNA-binding transcriptional ArsR family regulator
MQTVTHSDALARFGYALSDATGTEIPLLLREGPGYPSDLAEKIGVSRQILSNHLACLRGCGLVVAQPEGRRSRYELADTRIAHALDDLIGLVLAVDPACCPAAETACRDYLATSDASYIELASLTRTFARRARSTCRRPLQARLPIG